MHAIARG